MGPTPLLYAVGVNANETGHFARVSDAMGVWGASIYQQPMTRLLFVAAIPLAIAGCALGGDVSSSPVAPSFVAPTSTMPTTATPTQQWLRCSTDIVFQASALSGPLEPSTAQDEAAVIFRRFPAPPDIWRRLIDNDNRVVFAAANPIPWEGNSGGGGFRWGWKSAIR